MKPFNFFNGLLFISVTECLWQKFSLLLKFTWFPHRSEDRQKNLTFSPQNEEVIFSFLQLILFSYDNMIKSFEPAGNYQIDCYPWPLRAPKNYPEQCYIWAKKRNTGWTSYTRSAGARWWTLVISCPTGDQHQLYSWRFFFSCAL